MEIPKFKNVHEAMNYGLQKMKEQGGMCRLKNKYSSCFVQEYACFYRGEDANYDGDEDYTKEQVESITGKKCFIGHFIPDKNYKKELNSEFFRDLPVTVFGENKLLFEEYEEDFTQMQRFHDNFEGSEEEFLIALENEIEEEYGLTRV